MNKQDLTKTPTRVFLAQLRHLCGIIILHELQLWLLLMRLSLLQRLQLLHLRVLLRHERAQHGTQRLSQHSHAYDADLRAAVFVTIVALLFFTWR